MKEKKEPAGAKTDIATTSNVAEKANAPSVGDNRACSDEMS